MKQSKYIEKVTSYLHNKQNKQEIAIELQDHIDLNTQYYEDIGYDSESAFEKAELAMGDADIVGEELHSLESSSSTGKRIIITVCVISILLTAVIYPVSQDSGVTFFMFLLIALNYMLILKGLFFSYKYKNAIANIVLSINALVILFVCPSCITSCLYGYFTGEKVCEKFFLDLSYFDVRNAFGERMITAVFASFIIAQCLFLRIYILKQKEFKITLKLINIKNSFKTAILLFISLNIVLFGVIIFDSINCRNSMKEQASKELSHYSDLIKNHIDDFAQCEIEDVEAFMAANFPKGSYSLEYRMDDQNFANIKPDENLLVHLKCSARKEDDEFYNCQEVIELSLTAEYYDYFGTELNIVDIDKNAFANLITGTGPEKIKHPCFWSYRKVDGEIQYLYASLKNIGSVYFWDNSEVLGNSLFYNYENGHLCLYANDFWEKEQIVFDNHQKKIFDNYLKEEFYKLKPDQKAVHDNYEVNYDLFYNIYSVEYNKENSCYEVIFDYIAFFTVVENNFLIGVNNLRDYEFDDLICDDNYYYPYINTEIITFYIDNGKLNRANITDIDMKYDNNDFKQGSIQSKMSGKDIYANDVLKSKEEYTSLLNKKYKTKNYYEAFSYIDGDFTIYIEDGDDTMLLSMLLAERNHN